MSSVARSASFVCPLLHSTFTLYGSLPVYMCMYVYHPTPPARTSEPLWSCDSIQQSKHPNTLTYTLVHVYTHFDLSTHFCSIRTTFISPELVSYYTSLSLSISVSLVKYTVFTQYNVNVLSPRILEADSFKLPYCPTATMTLLKFYSLLDISCPFACSNSESINYVYQMRDTKFCALISNHRLHSDIRFVLCFYEHRKHKQFPGKCNVNFTWEILSNLEYLIDIPLETSLSRFDHECIYAKVRLNLYLILFVQ